MFLVEMDVRLGYGQGRRMTDDEVTDLIEKLVDELDRLPLEPSVGTTRVDGSNDIDMTIGVIVDDQDQFEALRHGAEVIRQGFESIGMGTTGLVFPVRDGLHTSVRALQPA